KRPSLEPGELAILYASVWQAVFGVVEVTGVPEHDPSKTRWAWRFPIRPLVLLRDLDRAPAVEEAGIFPQSLWRHSYIRLADEQLRRARERIPAAEFRHGDLTAIDFEPGSVDAVVSFYALNHVPREELGPLLTRIAGWLRPGGHLLAAFGASDTPAWRGEWLG